MPCYCLLFLAVLLLLECQCACAFLTSRLLRRQSHKRMEMERKATAGTFWPEAPIDTSVNEDDEQAEEENDRMTQVLDSILKIHCTHSEPDFLIPWQRQHQSTSTSSGFVISTAAAAADNKRVLTNAHSVEYGSIVQVQRRGDERKYPATIEVIANECDLAILDIDDKSFWNDLEPLEFGPLPALQDEVEVLGYPTGGDSLSITQGVVSRIEMLEYSQASTHLLATQIDAAINPGNSGGPVVNEDLQVIGVAFQGLEGAENIGYVVPVTVVQHVLHDMQRTGGTYTGFCSLGIGLCRLENTAFRQSLGMMVNMNNDDDNDNSLTSSLSGIMVKEVLPTAASKGILQPNDVICQVDGIPVANDGKIPFRPGERVALACYIQSKFPHDVLKLQVLRDGALLPQLLPVPASICKRLVPAHWDNRPPPYLIVAGLVFTALSVPYLHASEAWDAYVSEPMSYLLGLRHRHMEQPTDQVVVLAQVLAHRENLGYDTLCDLHLEKVNGVPVRSLSHLQQLLNECDTTFVRFELAPNNHIVVLKRSSLERVTQEICTEHSIPRPFLLHENESSDQVVAGGEGGGSGQTNGEESLETAE